MNTEFEESYGYKLIYIFAINDDNHEGYLKIGDTTIKTELSIDKLSPNCRELNKAAKKRIDDYTSSAGVQYNLLHTELAIYSKKGKNNQIEVKAFRDYSVHKVLENSGFSKRKINGTKGNEWFKINLETAVNAIDAVKQNRLSISQSEFKKDFTPIILRPEQEEAVKRTLKTFKTGNKMLWNAKMRFGKTLSALRVIKDSNFKKTIVVTHRPVVNVNWYEDFKKTFYDKSDFEYGSKSNGSSIELLLKSEKHIIYFASIQDLRGSSTVGGIYEKNENIFLTEWDCVIVDEAHEGTKTVLGEDVINKLVKEGKTKFLALSGTPFNILTEFENNIYTWDYVMEQESKYNYSKVTFGDSNPYDELPEMKIYTYDLGNIAFDNKYIELVDKAFNFHEFFRVWTGDIYQDRIKMSSDCNIGEFVHENDIKSFLDLITKSDETSNYPYSTEKYRNLFKHSLWMIPGVKEAKALSKLMKAHQVFGSGAFEIINVAGDGDEESKSDDALSRVKQAIDSAGEFGYTITLSCGRLTTGVTVPEWTAVMMLSGSYSTSATNYLQTIFRVQSPCNKNGKIKQCCYVFDFAPDRTLKMVAEAAALSTKAGKSTDSNRIIMGKFLNYCPVISVDGTEMKSYNVKSMLIQLKKAYSERVVRNGFDDNNLYNDELLKLNGIELEDFEKLKRTIGSSAANHQTNEIDINNQGFTDEEYEEIEKLRKKKKERKPLSPEEQEKLKELEKNKKQRLTAISVLRAISIRIPLLIYGANIKIDKDFTLENMLDNNIIDDTSWIEFMPKDVTREIFKKFIKYYDEDIFIGAGTNIRNKVLEADSLPPLERIKCITELFSGFKNPDKETVLTPWRVVNMHLCESLGGYDFYNEDYSALFDNLRFVDKGEITKKTLTNTNSKILEINSKSGLYPLFVTYSIFKTKCNNYTKEDLSLELQNKLWIDTVKENVYVICKTPMAKQITKRTLVGYNDIEINAHYFDDLINMLKNKPDKFIKKILKESYWEKEGKGNMKFNAVVGNPPYQGINHQQIYPFFYLTSIKLADYVSLIFPIGWQDSKNANNLSKLNKKEIKEDKQIVFIDNRQNIFVGISGAEWTNIILWEKNYDNKLNGYQKIYTNGSNPQFVKLLCQANKNKPKEIKELKAIIDKIDIIPLSKFTSSRKPYGLDTDIIKDNKKYNLPPLYNKKIQDDDIKIYCKNEIIKYVPKNYPFPRKGAIDKYKIFVPYAWGNMSEKTGLGGAFSNIILAFPNEACTETYLESMQFDNINIAKKHAKYLMSKFCRACLYINKKSQHSTTAWGDVPLQSYSEIWWNKSIIEIDEELFKKYKLPNYIRNYIRENFQSRSESNIINFE